MLNAGKPDKNRKTFTIFAHSMTVVVNIIKLQR